MVQILTINQAVQNLDGPIRWCLKPPEQTRELCRKPRTVTNPCLSNASTRLVNNGATRFGMLQIIAWSFSLQMQVVSEAVAVRWGLLQALGNQWGVSPGRIGLETVGSLEGFVWLITMYWLWHSKPFTTQSLDDHQKARVYYYRHPFSGMTSEYCVQDRVPI